jgi:2-polyprenyl-6-methoxyphenol hydroxylase-like FAD-dependent oxidoreductase
MKDLFDLKGKVAIITGVGMGGLSCGAWLAHKGMKAPMEAA